MPEGKKPDGTPRPSSRHDDCVKGYSEEVSCKDIVWIYLKKLAVRI
jgi:hypothetical protein